jgi:photosystem II stability/assembly factor-like uncharacterized protein
VIRSHPVKAAALCCGLFVAAAGAQVLPDSGPVSATTAQRLLLVDAVRTEKGIVAVGDRGYILQSQDGRAWKRARSPAAPLLAAVRFVDAKSGWAVGHDAVILATTDGGDTWTQQFSAPKEGRPLLDAVFADAQRGMAVGAYGAFYETADGGKTWKDRKISEDDKHFNAILALDAQRMLILGEAGTILVSGDAGQSWTAVPSPYKGSLFGAVVAADGAVVAYGLRGRILRSADGGKTWKQVENPVVATLMGGTRLADNTLVLAGAAGTALVSRDNGLTFTPIPTGTTRVLSKPVAVGDGVLFLGEAGPRIVPLKAPK